MKLTFLILVLLPVCIQGRLEGVSTTDEDEELFGGLAVPEDRECGFRRFLKDTETVLSDYGPNVCKKKSTYLESRKECNFRRICRRERNHFYCWYACKGLRRCITYESTYTFGPECCDGYASSHSSFVANPSSDINEILKTEGCPAVKASVVKATCSIRGDTVRGNITITQANMSSRAVITGEVVGLTPGLHGFHIHQYGNFQGGCGDAGGHYNPFHMVHGAPNATVRHVGDLGNIEADSTGRATIAITDHMVKLNGPISVIGRAFVVHADVDDLGLGGNPGSLLTGNAGARVGCCTIGIARP